MSDTPLDRIILGSVKCTICGAGFGECDCWVKCSCGHSFEAAQERHQSRQQAAKDKT